MTIDTKSKRTHPVGTYMLAGFVGLIIVAAISLPALPPAPETPQSKLNAERNKCFNFLTAWEGTNGSGHLAKVRACKDLYPEQKR